MHNWRAVFFIDFNGGVWSVCVPQTQRSSHRRTRFIQRCEHRLWGSGNHGVLHRPNNRQFNRRACHCDHFRCLFSSHSEGQTHYHNRNALRPHRKRVPATQNVSQTGNLAVKLEAMRRAKLDPKHVRDFFYHHALSVRLLTLFFDGVWWVIIRGCAWIMSGPMSWVRAWLPIRFKVDEHQRQLHTFVVGKTGMGKSVLLRHLIRHYQTRNRRPSVVVLDPHGDLAQAVARDRVNLRRDRMVFIKFSGWHGRFAHFNPFDLKQPTEVNLNRAQLHFAGAVEQIIGERFTPRQRTLVRACLGVMLHKPGTRLVDLVRLLQDGHNADLVQYGRERLPNEIDRQFFSVSFAEPGYRATKQALVSRLIDIVRDPVVRRFTGQSSSFDLGRVLDSGQVLVVCFDPEEQSADTIRTLGQLLNAAILSHVMGRSRYNRHPVHLFVDECQYFVSPTIGEILGESRKFGLYLTLATQRIERLETSLQDAVLGNVGTIWIGGSRHVTAEKLARETDVNVDRIRRLRRLEFLQAASDGPVKHQNLRYLGDRYAMTPREWTAMGRQWSKQYYRQPPAGGEVQRSNDGRSPWTPNFF